MTSLDPPALSSLFTQDTRLLGLEGAAFEGKLVVEGFAGVEGTNIDYAFDVSCIADNPALSTSAWIGEPACLWVMQANGIPRRWQGIVSAAYY